jgi:hypothetical protein
LTIEMEGGTNTERERESAWEREKGEIAGGERDRGRKTSL